MQTLHLSIIRFPEISLHPRDAHKLRGYLGNLFRNESPLLHNHLLEEQNSEGKVGFRYRYPLVQYKVIGHTPMLLGIDEGAGLLEQLFLRIREIRIEDQVYPVLGKNMEHLSCETGVSNSLHSYSFASVWMALNRDNYQKYLRADKAEQQQILQKVLTANVLSFFKGINYYEEQRILMHIKTSERQTQFKDQLMMAFEGEFTTNLLLPEWIGLGKSVSRGFGTIKKNN